MKKRRKQIIIFILVLSIGAAANPAGFGRLAVEAGSISDVQEQIDAHQRELERIYSQISEMEEEQDLRLEEIEDLNAEIINTMTSIGLKEEEIAAKEEEIAVKEAQIEDKRLQIQRTEAEYEAAREREETQRQSMAISTRLLYERGETNYLDAIVQGKGLAGLLNRMDYIEKIYAYSKARLEEYMETKEQVLQLWNQLEEEKTGLEADRQLLEEDRQQLKADEAELKDLKANLDIQMAKKEQESADFEAEIGKARQAAAVAKKLLQQEQQRLKQLQEAQKPVQNAANATYTTTDYTSIIESSSGSDLGKKVAKYACQFIGNPYVSGGTSLTNGADCSGFTYRVYQDFQYSLPRTSYQQRSAGTGVDYDSAQPGDLICYEGHVGIYIGGGLIVHASTSKTGIKVSRAQYKTILSVRRII
ncbi:MAG: C40 family peptidase [Acetatifactor sp.]|nr:C40 family peptidase [Acetatifactor sp.]